MAAIDLARLRDFSDGTPQGLQELCGMLGEHMREAADTLRPAVAARRADVLQVEAHKAAGTAGACGAARLSELLSAMETVAMSGELSGAPALMQEIDDEVARVRETLEGAADGEPERSRE